MIVYHGSSASFHSFRVKGKEPKELRVKGRKCVYLHADKDVVLRKYATPYLYVVRVEEGAAKPYADAIRDEGLRPKKRALTHGVWVALPRNAEIIERWRVVDGSLVLEYSAVE